MNIPDLRRILQRGEIIFILRKSTRNLFLFCLRFAEHLNWVKVDVEISLIFNGALSAPHNMANCECVISESQIGSEQCLESVLMIHTLISEF